METLIVPTDFSPAANNAIDYAVNLAKFFDARVILVHAYPVPAINDDPPFSAAELMELYDDSERKLRRITQSLYRKHGVDLDIEYVAEMGAPLTVIDSVAKANNADLIVMGIIGEAGHIKERFIGSTALSVARKQDVPTFIIPEKVTYRRIYKISFACDLKKTEETDLVYVAKFFSKEFDAELEIVNVEDPMEEVTAEKEATCSFIEEKLAAVKHRTVHITGSNAAHELEDYFSNCPTDLVMINPKKHNLFYYLFNNSVTNNLAFHSNLPILAIQ